MEPQERLSITADGAVLAECSLWWKGTAALAGLRTGYIGNYARTDAAAAQVLLRRARATLRTAGCAYAAGPIDGDTWHRYRFITQRGTRPHFLLEPDNPDCYAEDFRSAGFNECARYFSAQERLADRVDPRMARLEARLREAGVTIDTLDLHDIDAELEAIHQVSTRAFARNPLYTPIALDEFRKLYAPLLPAIDPAFVRIARCDGFPVGFAFGVRDGDALIGKTQARLPERRYAGLTALMLHDVRQHARDLGIRSVVHALISEGNVAGNAAARVAVPFRTYAVFGSSLT